MHRESPRFWLPEVPDLIFSGRYDFIRWIIQTVGYHCICQKRSGSFPFDQPSAPSGAVADYRRVIQPDPAFRPDLPSEDESTGDGQYLRQP